MKTLKQNKNILKALANINRMKIIDFLSCGELCVCEINKGLDLSQPTVSHHLKILEREELIISRKDGKWTRYSLNKSKFNLLINFLNTLTDNKKDCLCKNNFKNCSTKKEKK